MVLKPEKNQHDAIVPNAIACIGFVAGDNLISGEQKTVMSSLAAFLFDIFSAG